MIERQLILRLSSLGDVILASSALEALPTLKPKLDWVVAQEFRGLLEYHPKIRKLYGFQRSSGLVGWVDLCRELWNEEYTEVYDLHRNLRTLLMKLLFFYWSVVERRSFPRWKTVPKQRLRFYAYFIFKKFLPKSLRPDSLIQRCCKTVGGTGNERPNLFYLVREQHLPSDFSQISSSFGGRFLCVMPSSKWDGKKWPVTHFKTVLKKVPALPVILGTRHDLESLKLCELLQAEGIPFYSAVGKWNFSQTATVMAHSVGYFGVDTGLAHLSEAVGIPVTMLFGPTAPDMGFGPWQKKSKAIESTLWCRPCGKDGRFCFRMTQKYQCLTQLSPENVLQQMSEF